MCIAAALVPRRVPPRSARRLEARRRVLTVAAPLAVGAFALRGRTSSASAGCWSPPALVWFLTTLANADDPMLYSIGRVAGWCSSRC